MRLEDTIEIDCPHTTLYALISDVERHTELLPGYQESRIIERKSDTLVLQREALISGQLRRWKSEVTMDGKYAIYFTQLEGPLKGMKVLWDLLPMGHTTRLRIVHDVQVKPWWKKWWMERWIAKPAIEKTARVVLEAIKKAAEMQNAHE